VPEVHQQAQLLTGRLQVVAHLSAVFVGQLLDSLDFQDDLCETYEVGFIPLASASDPCTRVEVEASPRTESFARSSVSRLSRVS
jgi:hypothetical protein